jgi:hypothetical protein
MEVKDSKHMGNHSDDVDHYDDHGDGTSFLAHNQLASFSVSGPGHCPPGLHVYSRAEEPTQWASAVPKHVSDLPIPTERKARNRRPEQIDPVWLQETKCRERCEPFGTTVALVMALVEEAIRCQVPFGVVVFDA